MKLSDPIASAPYHLPQKAKEQWLVHELNALTEFHRRQCAAYDRILNVIYPKFQKPEQLSDMPWLPAGLFKNHKLASILDDQIVKILKSSGTTGQQVSKIYLDRVTAERQTQALSKIIEEVLGSERMPMLIIDSASTISRNRELGARAVGILGLMNFGRDHLFLLDENLQLKISELQEFLKKHAGKPIFIYGFTFLVWQYFYKQIVKLKLDLSQAILIHSGGWKKLHEEQVSNKEFKLCLQNATGLKRIYNFYGMVEQTGSIFMERDDGYLYTPAFADIIIRDPKTWQESKIGEAGVIQVLSTLPYSYPGHSILTEDLGIIHDADNSNCGGFGKKFSVIGRAPQVELRGCSDVLAYGQLKTI